MSRRIRPLTNGLPEEWNSSLQYPGTRFVKHFITIHRESLTLTVYLLVWQDSPEGTQRTGEDGDYRHWRSQGKTLEYAHGCPFGSALPRCDLMIFFVCFLVLVARLSIRPRSS